MTAAILDVRLATRPGMSPPQGSTTNLVHLLALARLPAGRQRLVCHWHHDAEGRLACVWEPDIALARHR
jgi:hypothetical protein